MRHYFAQPMIALLLAFSIGCATPLPGTIPADGGGAVVTAPVIVPQPGQECAQGLQAAISWELATNDGQVNQKAMPARRAWSEVAYAELSRPQIWKNFEAAQDFNELHPNMAKLTVPQQRTVVVEWLSTVAEYEASWGADHTSVDVNGSSLKDDLATGLFQMNVGDQKNYKTGTNYTHEQLKTAAVNIKVGILIMNYLLEQRGKIMFNKGEKSPVIRYFYATLLKDATYGAKTIAVAKKRAAALKFQTCK